jgi:hypothetical protein
VTKTIKSTASIVLLALLAALGFSACSDNSNSPFVGEWTLDRASVNGIAVSAEAFGLSSELTIKADGSFALSFNAESESGTWKTDGDTKIILTIGRDGRPVEMKDGELILSIDDDTLLFYTKK